MFQTWTFFCSPAHVLSGWRASHTNLITAISRLSKPKLKSCYDRRSVGQSVLVSSPHLRTKTRFLLLSICCGFLDVERPLWREDGFAIYNCCWSSPVQLFSGPSATGLVIKFYYLKFETHPAWRARSTYLYLPGRGWPSNTLRHWVPFSPPPTNRRATVEVFEIASTRADFRNGSWSSLYSLGMERIGNTASRNSIVGRRFCPQGLHRNHRSTIACEVIVTLMSCLLLRNLVTAHSLLMTSKYVDLVNGSVFIPES
jgi:hypothetical protein